MRQTRRPFPLIIGILRGLESVAAQIQRQQFSQGRRIARIERILRLGALNDLRTECTMSEITDALADLATEVHSDTDATSSILSIVDGLATKVDELTDQIEAGAIDPAEVAAQLRTLAGEVHDNASRLAEAAVANTPADPGTGGTDETPDAPVDEVPPADEQGGGEPAPVAPVG